MYTLITVLWFVTANMIWHYYN